MVDKLQERLVTLEWQAERAQMRLDTLEARSNSYKQVEIAIFIGAPLICIFVFAIVHWIGFVCACIGIIAFIMVIRNHRKIDFSIVKHRIWASMKETQIARLQLDWDALPPPLLSDPTVSHQFETDLDITGHRSLHRLINTSVSQEGSRRLRDWLLTTKPDPETIQSRQALIRELVPMTLFRNKLMVYSQLAARLSSSQLEGERLLLWLQTQPPSTVSRLTLFVSTLLSVATGVLLVLFLLNLTPLWVCIIPLVLSLLWLLTHKREQEALSDDANFLSVTFGQLSTIFNHLERYTYGNHQQLKKLCEPFYSDANYRPSVLFKKLASLALRSILGKEPALWLIVNTLLPWDFYNAYWLNIYRKHISKRLPLWLDTWFELEALSSLANFAYLNPDYTFPELVSDTAQKQSLVFSARGLGHPLLPPEKKVTNDFEFSQSGEIVLITGSNMAGKSTFLRTLGINLCLAYIGAPVNAHILRTSLFEIYACIKVSDSVTDGYSYFYAEVRRLKGLLDILSANPRYPLFFLIDEIFKGTNNRERLIGSQAYIQALVGKHCTGAISTHDLELVKLSDTLPVIKNYHFREEFINKQMVFYYLLHAGPSPTTNALKIMQLEGLPITIPAISAAEKLGEQV